MVNPKGKVDVPEEVRQKLKELARKYDADDKTDSKLLENK